MILAIFIAALIIIGVITLKSKRISLISLINSPYTLIFRFFCLFLSKEEISDVSREALEETIAEMNSELPKEVEEGMNLTSIMVESDYAINKIEVDEEIYNFNELRGSEKEIKNGIIDNLGIDADLYRKGKMGLIFEYYGNKNGERFIVKIEYTELC